MRCVHTVCNMDDVMYILLLAVFRFKQGVSTVAIYPLFFSSVRYSCFSDCWYFGRIKNENSFGFPNRPSDVSDSEIQHHTLRTSLKRPPLHRGIERHAECSDPPVQTPIRPVRRRKKNSKTGNQLEESRDLAEK